VSVPKEQEMWYGDDPTALFPFTNALESLSRVLRDEVDCTEEAKVWLCSVGFVLWCSAVREFHGFSLIINRGSSGKGGV
jgi:hypothetical protein